VGYPEHLSLAYQGELFLGGLFGFFGRSLRSLGRDSGSLRRGSGSGRRSFGGGGGFSLTAGSQCEAAEDHQRCQEQRKFFHVSFPFEKYIVFCFLSQKYSDHGDQGGQQ
jgi:hypothetical protein